MLTNSFHAVLVLTMSINRTLLAAFHSVANAGSFTAAAHEKSVTQSTLSVQVGQLEKTYGCKLFLRHGRSIALTETGRELYNLTRQQFDAEQEAEALLSRKICGPTGHLRMGAVSSVLVVEYLKTFLSAFPLSTLALEISNSQKIITDISDGNLDVGIIAFPIVDLRIEKVVLRQESLHILVGPDHEWRARKDVDFSKLADQTLILRERGSRTRQLIEDNLGALKISPRRIIELNEWAAVRELVQANVGVSIVPESEARTIDDDCKMRIRDVDMHITQFLIYRHDRRKLATLKSFLKLIAPADRSVSETI